mmetsp:Transcript_36103/g.62451  ORF Transcript_36103/g.62451 Transcript_36103/m.62451 type:complete len:227 (-) Transcript_36103:692-1372(-)
MVLDHALDLGGERRPLQLLEARDHVLLELHARRFFVEQTFGERVAVELSEHVLVREVDKKVHDRLETVFHRGLRQLLRRFVALEDTVTVGREQLDVRVLARFLVHELLERDLHRLLEVEVVLEKVLHHVVRLFVQRQHAHDHGWVRQRLLLLLRNQTLDLGSPRVEKRLALVLHELLKDFRHRCHAQLHPVQLKEPEHAVEILALLQLEQCIHARVRPLHQLRLRP